MTWFNTPPKFSRQILLLTAGIFLLAGTEAALAKHGGDSNDHGGMSHDSGDHDKMKSRDSKREGDSNVKFSQNQKSKNKDGDKLAENHKNKDKGGDKHADKNKDKDGDTYTETHKDKHGEKYSNNPPAPGTDGTNNIHPIISPAPAPVASGSGSPTDIAPPVNTIHPIINPNPVASGSGSPTGATLPVNTIVRDHRHPAGTDPNGEGGVTVPQYQGAEHSGFGGAGGDFLDGIADFGYGLTHGFAAGPAPPDPTSTYTQY